MNITLSNHKVDNKPQKNADQIRFDKLWKDVKNKQKRNDKLKKEMDALLATYRQKVMPVELGLEEPLGLLARRLIEFSSRKSLADWQRAELQDWIVETLHEISQFNAAEAASIGAIYNQAMADYYNISVDELTDPDPEWEDDINSASEPKGEEPESLDQEDLFGSDEEDDFIHSEEKGSTPTSDRNEQPINDKWIRNLFQRTARVLHPDKEQDPERRDQKQKLMSQLLDARDQQDVMTMMQLYNEHVDDGELSMEQAEINTLCRLLENQKNQLDMAREELIDESPMHYAVHGKFYAANKKTRDKKLQEHIEGIEEGIKRKFQLVEYLRNLTNLKALLEQRYDEKRHMGW